MHLYEPSRFKQVPTPHVPGVTAHSFTSEKKGSSFKLVHHTIQYSWKEQNFLTDAKSFVWRKFIAIVAHTQEVAHGVHTLSVTTKSPLARALVNV